MGVYARGARLVEVLKPLLSSEAVELVCWRERRARRERCQLR
jgi:hypothetical protein